jgi:hypothetical protein
MNLTLNFRTRSVAELEARGFFNTHSEQCRERWLSRIERDVERGYFKRQEEIPFHLPCCEAFDSIRTLKEHRAATPAHQQPSVYYVHSWTLPPEGHVVDWAQKTVGNYFHFAVNPADTYPYVYFDKWNPLGNYDDCKGVSLVADISLPFGGSSTGRKDWNFEVKQERDCTALTATWDGREGMKEVLGRLLDKMPSFIRLCRAGAKYDKALRLMKEDHQYQGAARSMVEGLTEMAFAFEIC